ncbi:MAG: hypothetical protein ACI9O6_003261 [Glaciecola sp.]|jgi:hypothetical protein
MPVYYYKLLSLLLQTGVIIITNIPFMPATKVLLFMRICAYQCFLLAFC